MGESFSTSRDNSLITWAPNLLALLGVIASVFFSTQPLESPRLDIPDSGNIHPDATNEVYKRLWEDPFDLKSTISDKSGKPATQKEVGDYPQLNCIISLNEEPTFEATEGRIRSRYAIISALLSSGYIQSLANKVIVNQVASDDSKMDPDLYSFRFKDKDEDDSKKQADPKTPAPQNQLTDSFVVIEQFSPTDLETVDGSDKNQKYRHEILHDSKRRYSKINLFYVPESLIFPSRLVANGNSFLRLSGILAEARAYLDAHKDPVRPLNVREAYLGPSGSAGFIALTHDLLTAIKGGKPGAGAKSKESVVWFSPWATISPDLVQNNLINGENDSFGKAYQNLLNWTPDVWTADKKNPPSPSSLHLLRTSATDDQLADAMLKELALRGLSPKASGAPPKTIVLVTEDDTIYGTAFPLSFTSKADQNYQAKVEVRSYLSGIDGEAPWSKPNNRAANKDHDEDGHSPASASPLAGRNSTDRDHPPLGPSQYDRIRALAEDLRHEEAGPNLPFCPRPHIFAVGVVGSDVYDKVVVLQALRQALPATLFFTTDLDALYTSPECADVTQNLLVASSYGFELRQPYQWRPPPFRNTYQTAVYASMFDMLNDWSNLQNIYPTVVPTPPESAKLFDSSGAFPAAFAPPRPQVYEIVRGGAKLLTAPATPSPAFADTTLPLIGRGYCSAFWPFLYWSILLMLISVWKLDIRNYGSDRIPWITFGSVTAFGVSLIGIAATAICFYFCWSSDNEEHFGWLDGASLWPTEMLRLMIIVLAIRYIEYSFVIVRRELNRGFQTLHGYPFPLSLLVPAENRPANSGAESHDERTLLWEWALWIWTSAARSIFSADPKNASICRGLTKGAVFSTLGIAALLFAVALFIHSGFGSQPVPSRGSISFHFDAIATVVEIACFCVLLASCIRLADWAHESVIRPFRNYCHPDTDDPSSLEGHPHSITFQVQMLEFMTNLITNVERLILGPFWLLLFVIISQNRFFDDWNFNVPLMMACFLVCLVLVVLATSLRTSFVRLRTRVRINVSNAILTAERTAAAPELPYAALLSRLDGLRDLDSVWSNPVLNGLAIVLTGAGGAQILSLLFR